jgi:hypothetical protein
MFVIFMRNFHIKMSACLQICIKYFVDILHHAEWNIIKYFKIGIIVIPTSAICCAENSFGGKR